MFLTLLVGLVILVIVVWSQTYTYWKRRGFPYVEPKFPFGCLDPVRKRQQSMGMVLFDIYRATSERFIGTYFMFRPALLIRDPVLARDIMGHDFWSFHSRGIYVDEEKNPFSGTLFALDGPRWKTLRAKLTPSFTSGKLKGMFSTIDEVGNKMLAHLGQIVPEQGAASVELKNLFSTYVIDIIGSAVVGLDIDSFKNPDNKFRQISRMFNEPTLQNVIRLSTQFFCPRLEKLWEFLKWKLPAVESMKEIVRNVVEDREKNNEVRRDIMQLLIQLRNTGKINVDDEVWDVETTADEFKAMSIESIAGQAYLFYLAGHEASASATAFTIFEFARNPEILSKVQKDIDNVLERHHGIITYSSIQEMKYLDICLKETMRKYPTLPMINRQCTKNYMIPNTDKVIEKGTPIVISAFGLHRDPEYFPNPLRYEPERFLDCNQGYDPKAYMPFGEGPRHCIAQRMGIITVKVAVIKILTHYNLVPLEDEEIEFAATSITLMPKGGINVQLTRKDPTSRH